MSPDQIRPGEAVPGRTGPGEAGPRELETGLRPGSGPQRPDETASAEAAATEAQQEVGEREREP